MRTLLLNSLLNEFAYKVFRTEAHIKISVFIIIIFQT